MADQVKTLGNKQEGDPAEFLLSNPKYHDCQLIVGDPDKDDVETIGVSSTHLIAHSPVFREILTDSKPADPSGAMTHIKDVSPATFKLMLRHVYGGKLPKMTAEETVELALCADKYNIQRLVWKTTKRLKPTSAEDIFNALMCVAHINCPNLELQVTKIIQQETDEIVQNQKFLELDETCVLYIVKQSILNISEVELWHNLVRWAESKVQKYPEKTRRACLDKILPYVRFLTLSSEEIAEHVLPTKILTPEEYVELSLAISHKQPIQSPAICGYQEKRLIYSDIECEKEDPLFSASHTLDFSDSLSQPNGPGQYSTLAIKPYNTIKIDNFMFRKIDCVQRNIGSLFGSNISLHLLIYKSEKGSSKDSFILENSSVNDENIVFPIMRKNGQPLVLEAHQTYMFELDIEPSFLSYRVCNSRGNYEDEFEFDFNSHFKLSCKNPVHFLKIEYRVKRK